MNKTEVHVSQYPDTFYRVSLKAIIRNHAGEVLVCKEYDSDSFSLPGGGWDHGETEKEALARELHEEVGYVGDFKYQPLNAEPFWMESKQAWLLWIVYDVSPDNYDFKIGEYCSCVEFVNPKIFKESTHRIEQWIYKHLAS